MELRPPFSPSLRDHSSSFRGRSPSRYQPATPYYGTPFGCAILGVAIWRMPYYETHEFEDVILGDFTNDIRFAVLGFIRKRHSGVAKLGIPS